MAHGINVGDICSAKVKEMFFRRQLAVGRRQSGLNNEQTGGPVNAVNLRIFPSHPQPQKGRSNAQSQCALGPFRDFKGAGGLKLTALGGPVPAAAAYCQLAHY